MPVQFDDEAFTSYTVWFTVAEIICESDLEPISGMEERVETHRFG